MPSEAAVEDAPIVVSTPSPQDVQCVLAPDDDSACRIASDAARESVRDGSSSGCGAAVQGMSPCAAYASPSCPQGPPACWIVEELFARLALNGSLARDALDVLLVFMAGRMCPRPLCTWACALVLFSAD
ncbi:hypothetical protein Nepgr_008018 [Nepenthes gracilis]|uniref:Uncharacterized protein n=1 Tax=Nepenthes gracilis TaxID=150966 RepID=A0AAD3XIU9_NEPGR|nr:hypothetical protein Nepgr_008018 [Nepenthes gracilis]